MGYFSEVVRFSSTFFVRLSVGFSLSGVLASFICVTGAAPLLLHSVCVYVMED